MCCLLRAKEEASAFGKEKSGDVVNIWYSYVLCCWLQFDALCEKLNAYELLTMYARLRGIPERRIAGIVDQAVQQLNLSKWADRQCGTYR